MLNISHRQTTAHHPESNGAVKRLHCHLKDALCACATVATWSEELPFELLGLRAQPRQFLALLLCCLMNFCRAKKFLLILFLKIVLKLWMFPLFLCLGTILAPSCQRCSPPPCLGPSWRHHSTSPTTLRQPLCHSAPGTPILHHPSRVPGRGHRHQPPQGLYGCGRPTWQPALPQQTAGLSPSRSCFQTHWFLRLLLPLHPETVLDCLPTRRGGFCTPGTGDAFTVSTEAVPVPSMGTAT
jgi:hypothetical protein